jgi:hypothetical protein
MRTDETICLNSLVNGKQPSVGQRFYWWGGVFPAVTVCFNNYVIYLDED